MDAQYTDSEIRRLLEEPKLVEDNFYAKVVPKPKKGHKGAELSVIGERGSCFAIMVRQAIANPLDFSVILAVEVPGSNQRFILRRYNGKSHQHSNPIEGEGPFYDFHIHTATERYQRAGYKEEHYATITDRYSSWPDALNCLVSDCNVIPPPGGPSLFPAL